MPLVTVTDLSLSFLDKRIFQNLGFQVNPGDRIGLIGPNGSGKTTLLRLLTREIRPDSGEISLAAGLRIGYLPQDIRESLTGDLLQSVIDSVPHRIRLRDEAEEMVQCLRECPEKEDQERFGARMAEIHQEIHDLDRAYPTHYAEKILAGLGFKEEEFKRPFSSFSGGWKMRGVLGSLLFQNPELLLLDEPTNHLDIPSIHWLEEFLQGYHGAMILICHDKDFLNRQIKRVISFEPEGTRQYSGNYDRYLTAREEEKKSLEAKARNQEMKIKEAKKFIERFHAKASKARQAQSKIKLVKKMELVRTHRSQKGIRFSFPQVPRSGRVVLDIKGLSKGFDEKVLYKDLQMHVLRRERIAIIGPNGSGKTTLLRMVAGEMSPDEGRITSGHGVEMSYYAQHQAEVLNPERSVLEEVYQVVPQETVGFVRSVCGAFLFSGNDVGKKVGVLSGGERARVCLAKLLVRPGNLLVMDEPTNHLDLISSEILIDALSDFSGTLLFVSHNQSFINRLATKVWDIRDQAITQYPGNLDEYYDHLSLSEGPEDPDNRCDLGPLPKSPQSKKLARREKAERRRLISDTLSPMEQELSGLEDRVGRLERREKEVEKNLADPEIFRDKERSVPLLREYNDLKNEIENLMKRWEEKQEELESAKKEFGIF
jgi:ATP-binding cassette subfamily F protein 3